MNRQGRHVGSIDEETNPNCDLAIDDHKVDGRDLDMLFSHYGNHYP